MSIEFRCSQCGRLLRTSDDTVGRMAQCPECGAQTRVPEPEAAISPPFTPPSDSGSDFVPRSAEPSASTGDWQAYQASAGPAARPGYSGNTIYALKRVSAPAVCLIITAVIGLCFLFLGIIENIMHMGLVAHGGPIPVIFMGPVGIIFHAIGLCITLVVLIGSIKMKQLENYGLAMTASILALIPCTSPCCFLGLPFGIWALVVLSDPIVRMSFKS